MNIYDFDNTIYNGDSSIDFALFCIKKKFSLFFSFFPFIFAFFLFKVNLFSKKKMKETFFSFLEHIKNVDEFICLFWVKHEKKINKWYLKKKKYDDIIISASPYFLLFPIAKKMNFKLISTLVNKKTGLFESENCYGNEKLTRLEQLGIKKIDEFYSDSLTDTPVAKIANKAFLVKKNKIIEWTFK